jgi:acetylornithine/N-succinyldiaminopimelate aminotransferase
VEHLGILLKQRLAALKDQHPAVIAEIRGEGLMMGIKTHVPNTDFITPCGTRSSF